MGDLDESDWFDFLNEFAGDKDLLEQVSQDLKKVEEFFGGVLKEVRLNNLVARYLDRIIVHAYY